MNQPAASADTPETAPIEIPADVMLCWMSFRDPAEGDENVPLLGHVERGLVVERPAPPDGASPIEAGLVCRYVVQAGDGRRRQFTAAGYELAALAQLDGRGPVVLWEAWVAARRRVVARHLARARAEAARVQGVLDEAEVRGRRLEALALLVEAARAGHSSVPWLRDVRENLSRSRATVGPWSLAARQGALGRAGDPPDFAASVETVAGDECHRKAGLPSLAAAEAWCARTLARLLADVEAR